MKLYIIWNKTEKRPLVNRENFGSILTYLNIESAQAYLAERVLFFNKEEKNLEIKEVTTTS